ncbi:MAG: hypothetical protein QG670_1551 [Thermoproteota archaeon]|nr:hypothetical protein [Thermoproteota archaeon]
MKFSIQTEDLNMLKESVQSNCYRIRFGPEFCELKTPSLSQLKEAYSLVTSKGKEFVYVTPFFSDSGLKKIREHLTFLNEIGRNDIVVNDLGTLNLLKNYPSLKPHLGRQLVFIPARCPWPQITERKIDSLAKSYVEELFYQTSLNYISTIQFYKKWGVDGIDVDWIPKCFPNYEFLAKNGFKLSIHTNLTPVTVTRRCHTARFSREKSIEECSRPCSRKAFLLKHDLLNSNLALYGNVVFQVKDVKSEEAKGLYNMDVAELVISMNPLTKIQKLESINSKIRELDSLF